MQAGRSVGRAYQRISCLQAELETQRTVVRGCGRAVGRARREPVILQFRLLGHPNLMSPLQPTPNVQTVPITVLTDPAGCEECCLVPGSLQRVRRMQALREQGWSLDEIALRFGVSRERVRQIMRAHGGPAPQDIAEARRRRAEAQAEARIDELLARWRAGEAPRVAASELGLQAAACRSTIERFATDADRAARKASMAGARCGAHVLRSRHHPRARVGRRRASGRVPSAKEYAAACPRAGLPEPADRAQPDGRLGARAARRGHAPAERPPRAPRPRRWTEEACWVALRKVVARARRDPDRARLRAPRRGPCRAAVVRDAAQPARALERDRDAARRAARARASRRRAQRSDAVARSA